MSRTSYAKCSRTFRRPCPQQKKFFSIFFFKIYSSKRIKMTCFEKNLFSPIISEIYHFTLLTPPPPHHHHQSRNDISTTQVSKISTCTLTITCLPTKKKFEKIFLINMFITYFGPSRVLTLYIRALGSTRIWLGASVVQRDWCSDSGRGVYSQPVLTLVCVGFVIRVWTVLLDTLARFYNGRVELVCWRVTKMLTDCVCVVLLRVREL